MEHNNSLADLLEQYMQERNIRDARLATLCNEISQSHEFIHRSTIRNWRMGASKTVKDWRQLVVISSALRLDEELATQLLLAGGCASIRDLRTVATDEQQRLFASWPEKPVQTMAVDGATTALPATALDIQETEQDGERIAAGSGFPLSLRIMALSALTALALIVALGFVLNRMPQQPTLSSPTATVEAVAESEESVSDSDSPAHSPTIDSNASVITIYDDALRNGWGWQERSSKTEVKVQSSKNVYAGEFALCATIQEYGALALSPLEPLPVSPDHHIEFQIHGTESVHGDLVFFINNEEGPEGHTLTTIDLAGKYIEGGRVDASSWRAVSIPLRDTGFDGEIVKTLTEINIHSAYAGEIPTIFLDDIQVVDAAHARQINNPADG